MRVSKCIRRLLQEALREKDPERAVELFLAARLLYVIHLNASNGEVEIKKIMEKMDAVDAGLQRIYTRLKALLEST